MFLANLILEVLLSGICIAAEANAIRDVPAGVSAFPNIRDVGILRRALPNSPSGGYAPGKVPCPAVRPTIRSARTLSPNETAWLNTRRAKTVAPMIDFLTRANISGFDASAYIKNVSSSGNGKALPNIGIAMSGGGYRAMLNGAGFLAAADSRTINSTNPGGIGGLLQSATYLSALSGGGWLVGSMFTNNFSSVQTLRDGSQGSDIWQLSRSIFKGPKEPGISILNTGDYFDHIVDEVKEKRKAGFNTTITDYWGRALSFQLINATDGGPAYTFSSIALADNFQNGETPFPILVSDARAPGTFIISMNSTIFEFNPYELGTWDPTAFAFAPLEYLGSKFFAGAVPPNETCIRGFDQAGFIMGTSSSLFNQFLLHANNTETNLPNYAVKGITRILQDLSNDEDDIAMYAPNPFFAYNNKTNHFADTEKLTLVDGGEDSQNVPLHPLIQPVREVDVIFAVDSTANTNSWPNGGSLVETYRRSLNSALENGTSFPAIPDTNTFVNLGLNSRPTFFGCDAQNTTGPTPLIVYVPNAPYIVQSNVSTFHSSYNNSYRDLIIRNGYDVATMGNGTRDAEWPTCVGCAILSRSFFKTGTEPPAACTSCYKKFCWNGTIADHALASNYSPAYILDAVRLEGGSPASLRSASLIWAVMIPLLVGLTQL